MTRKYSLVIEGDPGAYSAYVSELPSVLVTERSIDEISSRASEAIQLYCENLSIDRSPNCQIREIEVDLAS